MQKSAYPTLSIWPMWKSTNDQLTNFPSPSPTAPTPSVERSIFWKFICTQKFVAINPSNHLAAFAKSLRAASSNVIQISYFTFLDMTS